MSSQNNIMDVSESEDDIDYSKHAVQKLSKVWQMMKESNQALSKKDSNL